MKAFLTIGVAISLILFSCDTEEIVPPSISIPECVPDEEIVSQDSSFYVYDPGLMEHGSATAIKINLPWEASAVAKLHEGKLELAFSTFASPEFPEHILERLAFHSIPFAEGCYEIGRENDIPVLDSTLYSYYQALDYDVLEDRYFVDSTQSNYIEVIDIVDSGQRSVAGKFMVSYYRDTTRVGKPYNPDTVRFFNGRFEAEVVE